MTSNMNMDPEKSERQGLAKSRLGRKAQLGGGLAMFIGILLLLFLPTAVPGAPVDLHRMVKLFIAIGAFLVAAGTVARWYFL